MTDEIAMHTAKNWAWIRRQSDVEPVPARPDIPDRDRWTGYTVNGN
jgi:hypothetical protein